MLGNLLSKIPDVWAAVIMVALFCGLLYSIIKIDENFDKYF